MGRAEEAPNRPARSGEGLRHYYLSHIHDLLLQLRVKTHNLHRLEAQRNDLNSKGSCSLQSSEFSIALCVGVTVLCDGFCSLDWKKRVNFQSQMVRLLFSDDIRFTVVG